MLSKMSAHADMSRKRDKKSSRTFQRNFSEEKFLSGRPPGEGSPSLRLRRKFTHSCARRRKGFFRARALRSATKGSAFGIRKPSRRLDPSFVPWCASKFYVNITWVGQIFIDITRIMRNRILTIRIRISRQLLPAGAAILTVGVKLNSDHRNSTSRQLRRR